MIKLSNRTFLGKQNDKIRFLFRFSDGFMVRNLRFRIKWAKHNPKGKRLHIQIWTPFLCLIRDNNKWVIGNKYQLQHYHN